MSLVEALSARLHKKVTRINLFDQTDIADLFGVDPLVEGGAAGHFQCRNGLFLHAMECGHWILLDELNLTSQYIFNHRNKVYIPELNRTLTLNADTKIFECQNSISEGGDRKGLPKSCPDCVTRTYVIICRPSIPPSIRI